MGNGGIPRNHIARAFLGPTAATPFDTGQVGFELELALNLDKELEVKIGEVNGLIRKALDRHMDIDQLVGVRRRLLDLRNNIGKALDRLTSVLIGDFSNPDEFTENLGRVIQALGADTKGA